MYAKTIKYTNNFQYFLHKKFINIYKTMKTNYLIGLDFGSDSVRSLIIDAGTGRETASATAVYTRWSRGEFCNPQENRYRQHPLDHIEAMEKCITEALEKCSPEVRDNISAIGYDTTASTPVLTDRKGTPLALTEGFAEDPDAMFILWKDHTATKEADEINEAAHSGTVDYTKYSGGSYSCEWVWAKALHCLRNNEKIREAAWSWSEHCDWIGGLLTGNTRPETMYRGRCTAGHKAMWNAEWGGLPPIGFFKSIDPLYGIFEGHLYSGTVTAGTHIGGLCKEWAERLGLKEGIAVAMGAIDCHAGAVGCGIEPGTLVKVMGTSTCDIAIAPSAATGGRIVRGICGQVDGSVLPGYIGFEAGQAAFGDIYAWFRRLVGWSLGLVGEEERKRAEENILKRLNEEAAALEPSADDPVALDWHNGRRTPDLDTGVKGAVSGLTLATTAPQMFKAFVEATAFGARAINERFIEEGVEIKKIIAVGGISKKSPYVMQTLSDVLGAEIRIAQSEQACALGSCIFAAAAAGLFNSVEEAREQLSSPFSESYSPIAEHLKIYDILYDRYRRLAY